MKKIDKIRIKNFKAFPELQEFDLKGKNLLVYGNNGSGKSSLYWALYTLLQSSEKTVNRVNDYFAVYDDNKEETFQSLRNVFSTEEDSYVEIEFQGEQPIKIEQGNIANVQTASVKEANKASDFINYKLLHNFYNSTHKSQLNLWNVFRHDIFPYFSEGSKTYLELLEDIETNQQYDGRTSGYSAFLSRIISFNSKVEGLLGSVSLQANKVLKDKFKITDIIIKLEYDTKLAWSRTFNTPSIKLSIQVDNNGNLITNHRPQSFLNEAALTRIAISIRLGALLTRLATSEWKILVLDDMLISLDMSNRMIVSKIILEDVDLQDFQKIILTHDRIFFNILKSATNCSEWEYLDFYKDEKILNSKPLVTQNQTYLEKAEVYFQLHEYEIAGNFLRKEAEAFCKDFLPKKYHFTKDYSFHNLSGLIVECKDFAIEAGLDKTLFEALDSHRKFVLNPTSHDSYDVPKFNSEIDNCLQTLKALREIKNEPFLKRGEQVEFELTSEDGTKNYKFDIKLEDDFRLLQEPNKESVISKGMVNYWVTKNGTKGELQHKQDSLKKMYDCCYNKSDLTKDADFWEGIIISHSREKLSTLRIF